MLYKDYIEQKIPEAIKTNDDCISIDQEEINMHLIDEIESLKERIRLLES